MKYNEVCLNDSPWLGSEATAAAAAAAAGGPDLGALFADHELMTHRALGYVYERRALVAELLRLFRAQDA
jgi:hypothetical protein